MNLQIIRTEARVGFYPYLWRVRLPGEDCGYRQEGRPPQVQTLLQV